ncbi:MAG: FtsB family cell division protein, partial [Cytophagales bacterium]
KIIPFFRNFYFTTGFFLLIWMFFFDANDFISQNRLTEKRKDLQKEKAFYLLKIEEVKKEKQEVFGSKDLLEKFARERYLMKKPTEDIYILKEN